MDSKLIFFDIDGTLALEPSGIIPDSTRIAIAGAKKNGHRVFVNTGRTFYSISEDIRSMEFDGYVCGCGTYIYYRGEKLLEPTAALLGELLLDPVTRNGRYLPEYVDSERANLLDSIRSVRNDKRDWADLRLLQEMCRDEPYGVSRLGDETAAAAINNQKLHVYSQGMMSASRLELFYCGSAPITRVEDALLEAFAALPRGAARDPQPPRRVDAPAQPRVIREAMDVTQ